MSRFLPTTRSQATTGCVEYVQYWRENFVLNTVKYTGQHHTRLKHHALESHVPPFAIKYKSIGRYGEGVIEVVHKVTNNLRDGRYNNVKNKNRYFRLCDDDANQSFESGCKNEEKKALEYASKRQALEITRLKKLQRACMRASQELIRVCLRGLVLSPQRGV